MRKTCTPAFRDIVVRLYPGLGDDHALWRLMRRLLFSTKLDRRTGRVIIDQRALASDADRLDQHEQHNFRAVAFLRRFKREVMPDLDWEDFSWVEGKARTAIVRWPPEMARALDSSASTS